ncbi:MAG: hypothetical protein FWE53_02970 [Firmicutes bacterium]|nr:hypothetical protein [Bacillota bacterium]
MARHQLYSSTHSRVYRETVALIVCPNADNSLYEYRIIDFHKSDHYHTLESYFNNADTIPLSYKIPPGGRIDLTVYWAEGEWKNPNGSNVVFYEPDLFAQKQRLEKDESGKIMRSWVEYSSKERRAGFKNRIHIDINPPWDLKPETRFHMLMGLLRGAGGPVRDEDETEKTSNFVHKCLTHVVKNEMPAEKTAALELGLKAIFNHFELEKSEIDWKKKNAGFSVCKIRELEEALCFETAKNIEELFGFETAHKHCVFKDKKKKASKTVVDLENIENNVAYVYALKCIEGKGLRGQKRTAAINRHYRQYVNSHPEFAEAIRREQRRQKDSPDRAVERK